MRNQRPIFLKITSKKPQLFDMLMHDKRYQLRKECQIKHVYDRPTVLRAFALPFEEETRHVGLGEQ